MAIGMPDSVKKYLDFFTKGVIANQVPNIAKGMLNHYLTSGKVTVKTITELVETKTNLWEMMKEEHRDLARRMIKDAGGDLNWLTIEWFVESLRGKHSSLASLLISWPNSRTWLNKQLEIFKTNLSI